MSPRMRRVAHGQPNSTRSDAPSITLSQLDAWFQTFYLTKRAEQLRPRTLADHEKHYRYFRQFMHNHYLDTICSEFALTTDVFRTYILYMTEQHKYYDGHPTLRGLNEGRTGLSPVTINVRLRSLKCFLKFLYDEEHISQDVASKIKLLKTEADLIESFTEEQVKLLLAQPDQRTYVGYRDYCLMVVLLDTGARINEILGVTRLDFDPARNSIAVHAALAKNKHGRILPLSRHTVKLLIELMVESAECFPNSDQLFLSEQGTPLTPSGVRQRLSKYERLAGIEGVRTSPHTFRHTFAKLYVLNGGDAFTLQRILDHSTMDMVRKYIQMNSSDIEIQHQTFSPLKNILSNRHY